MIRPSIYRPWLCLFSVFRTLLQADWMTLSGPSDQSELLHSVEPNSASATAAVATAAAALAAANIFGAGEAQLHAILDHIPAAIYILTTDHRYLFVNRYFEEDNQVSGADICGLSVYDRFPPAAAAALAANEQQVLKNRTSMEFEESVQRGPETRWYTTVKTPLFDAAGEPSALLGVSIDITARKRQELDQHFLADLGHRLRLLNGSDAMLELLVESLGQYLQVAHCRINEIDLSNRRFAVRKSWSNPPASVSGSAEYYPLAELAPPEILDELQSGRTVVVDNTAADPRTSPVVDKYRAQQNSAFIGVPLFHQGRWWATLSVRHNSERRWQPHETALLEALSVQLHDLLDRVRAEESLRELNATLEERVAARTAELERSNRDLDQFVYSASHDLKSPLRGIDLLARWIEQDAGGALPPNSQEHLTKLRRRVQRMDRLLEDLLAYAHIGRRSGRPEVVDTGELVRSIGAELDLPQGFTVTVAAGMPTIRTVRAPLAMVFHCLLDNAAKHHHDPGRGSVHVAGRDLGICVEFTVTDDGPGIEPQYHVRIFEVFQTLRPRDELEGSGMGLAIARRAVEYAGGAIRVESPPGGGVTFHFTWPH